MSNTHRPWNLEEIPDGLEVAPNEDKETVVRQCEGLQVYHNEKDLASSRALGLNNEAAYTSDHSPRRISRQRYLLAIGFAVLAVVGIVIGAVVGSRSTSRLSSPSLSSPQFSDTSSSITSLTSGSTTQTAAPLPSVTPLSSPSLRERSAISVTGWSSSDGFSIRLFYQGGDGKVRLSSYESSTGNWDQPVVLAAAAKEGTSLGSSSIPEQRYFGFSNTKSGFQLEMFYLNEQNILQEWTISDSKQARGSSSDIGLVLSPDSKIVSYWPSVLYQAANGDMTEMVLNGPWGITNTQHKALLGSSLVEVPYFANFPDGGRHVFYQQEDGTVATLVGNSSVGWSPSDSLPKIPKGGSIGVFVISNKQAPSQSLDTYFLWQDANGTIQLMWHDDETGWIGPRAPSAFEGADSGTSIACLTPIAWEESPLRHGDLQPCRCYFQSSGSLKQAWFNGTDFELLADVSTT